MKQRATKRDRGSETIGGSPENWQAVKIKYVAQLSPKCNTTRLNKESIVSFAPMECVKAGCIEKRYVEFCMYNSSYNLFSDGDILMAKVTPCFENGNLAIASELASGIGFGSSELFILRCFSINTRYLFYYFMSHEFMEFGRSTMYGVAGLKRVNADLLRNRLVPLPPIDEQERITRHIEDRIKKIDTLVAEKLRLIDLLKEKRQAIISEAVTKGLDKHAKMKDSGVAWVGMIPEGWSIYTNHQLFGERREKNTQDNATLLSVTKYLGVILQSEAEELALATVAPSETLDGYAVVRKGDLVMNIMRAKDGSFGISSYDGVISPAYCIYYAKKQVNSEYLYYLFKTPMYIETFKNYSTGIAEHRMRLYPDDFYKIPAIVPPLEEQNAIAAYLNKATSKIDDLVALEETQIEKLKEYRQSIISDAVTGKAVI